MHGTLAHAIFILACSPGYVRSRETSCVGPLEVVAQLDLSDSELSHAGLALSERDWWDGLGDYSGCFAELPDGEQFLLRRLDLVGALDVLGLIERDADEQVTRLLAALGVDRVRVQWQTSAEAWELAFRRGLSTTRGNTSSRDVK